LGDAAERAGSYRRNQSGCEFGEVRKMARTIRAARVRQPAGLDPFRPYLDQVGRHPLLTSQDEARPSQACQQGLDAQRQLTQATGDPLDPPTRAHLKDQADRASGPAAP
jgi:hypothetical protein